MKCFAQDVAAKKIEREEENIELGFKSGTLISKPVFLRIGLCGS